MSLRMSEIPYGTGRHHQDKKPVASQHLPPALTSWLRTSAKAEACKTRMNQVLFAPGLSCRTR